jgi:hypothetical protein
MKIFDTLAIYLAGLACGMLGAAWGLHREPPPVQAMNGHLIRRVEMKLVDTRANPDRNLNPSYMEPNMRFTCVETP